MTQYARMGQKRYALSRDKDGMVRLREVPYSGVGADALGGEDNPSAVDTGLVSPSTAYGIESALAKGLGFVPNNQGGFVPSKAMIPSVLNFLANPVFALMRGIYSSSTNPSMMAIQSQMPVYQAMQALQAPSAYGGGYTTSTSPYTIGMMFAPSDFDVGVDYGGYEGGGYGMPGSEGVGGLW